jgi:putative aminopeptidase FrvX
MSDDLELLRALCAAPGVPGFEAPVAQVIRERLSALAIETTTDAIGNVTAHLAGVGPRALLFCHMDEVGLLVRRITPDGFLLIERVGGASHDALLGQRLDLWTEHGALPALVGVLPQHVSNGKPAPGLEQMYIDIGANSSAEAEAMGVQVGSPLTYRATFEVIHERLVSAKALDNRLGCYVLLRLAEALQWRSLPMAVYLGFTVQEETRLAGAIPLANRLRPDWAVGVDATLAFDTPDLHDGQTDLALGQGPAIKVMDHVRGAMQGLIAHPGLRRHIEGLARQHGLPFQRELVIGLSTAATPLPFVGEGIPTAAVSIPIRYSHSPVETADLRDVRDTCRLLEALVIEPFR